MTELKFDTLGEASRSLAQQLLTKDLIGIDGWTNAGKSTLGRKLAAATQRHSFLDLDFFLIKDRNFYVDALRLDDLAHALQVNRQRVLVGVCLRQSLERVGVQLDASVYLKRMNAGIWADEDEAVGDGLATLTAAGFPPSDLSKEIRSYHLSYSPHATAEFVVEVKS